MREYLKKAVPRAPESDEAVRAPTDRPIDYGVAEGAGTREKIEHGMSHPEATT